MPKIALIALTTSLLLSSAFAQAQTLKGSRGSMERQYQVAVQNGYGFAKTASLVKDYVSQGELIQVRETRFMELHDVSFPYARPPVKEFIDKISAQYFAYCGEKLTVTSLTRPIDKQPNNAASDSVHPTGMAVDLRIPPLGKCRTWLERTLLSMESSDVLDVTRERRPPHYHVAVFPEVVHQFADTGDTSDHEYVVRRGDTLSRISSITGVSVAQLKSVNGLRNDTIIAGQKLQVPAAASSPINTVRSNEVASYTETTHRVRRGDTLWRLAKRYGTTVDAISKLNDLAGDALQIGQVLKVAANRSSL
ncbi:MAG: LysM peptidoglycan-binding domain-containing protein [Pseudomonadales bacterium]|nr:LysM peptidoglycan-binding domain-containing protein [Pseudomonadales bacterium]MCP5345185.1 LysM peptidoglycan-binding domain-containing protein [Pseudomonadales bacterium]MCP5359081.1 LysM peptidoglycan-binding domain-containing protein [Pseudomonadales bacterium]